MQNVNPITLHFNNLTVPCNLLKTSVCGGVDGEFTCELTIETDHIDGEGFAIEVTRVESTIKDRFDPSNGALLGSCEVLGQGVIRSVLDLFAFDGRPTPLSINCHVRNLVGGITSTYKRGSDLTPEFPRHATKAELKAAEAIEPSRRGSC